MATLFLVQSGGKIYNTVKNPAAVYDRQDSVLLKIGEWEAMYQYWETVQQQYRTSGFAEMADDICIMELPKSQEEIDKVFGICDYIGKLHRQAIQ